MQRGGDNIIIKYISNNKELLDKLKELENKDNKIKQIYASKGKLHLGDLKGYANKFFCSRSLYFAFKKYDKDNKINC